MSLPEKRWTVITTTPRLYRRIFSRWVHALVWTPDVRRRSVCWHAQAFVDGWPSVFATRPRTYRTAYAAKEAARRMALKEMARG